MMLLLYLLPIFITLDSAVSETAQLSTGVATPTCLQTRQPTDPAASSIATALSYAVPNACNPSLEKGSTNGTRFIGNYQVDLFNFNVSHALNTRSSAASPSACPDAFNTIITSCVEKAPGAGFWGGWMLQGPNNYSISNFNFPANSLVSLASSVQGPLSGLVGTRQPLSQSAIGVDGSRPSKMPIYSSTPFLTWSYTWQSATMLASNNGPSSGGNTRAASSSSLRVSSASAPTPNVSGPGIAPGSGRPPSRSRSMQTDTAYIEEVRCPGQA